MSSQVVVSPGGDLHPLGGAGTEAGSVGHAHHPPHVGRGQPTLLVVVGPGQLPAVLLNKRDIIMLSRALSPSDEAWSPVLNWLGWFKFHGEENKMSRKINDKTSS